MHSLIVGLAALALTPTIAQGEWIKVSSTNDSGSVHSIRTVDIATWSPSSRANRVWLKSDLTKKEGLGFSKVIALNIVNCPDQNFKAHSIMAYYRDGTNEELPTDPNRTISLTPDSVIARVADVVCHAPQSNDAMSHLRPTKY